MTKRLGLPRLLDVFTEQVRAGAEAYDFFRKRDELIDLTPPGDGRPVMILPGFGASDISTKILRDFLRDKGYEAHGWGGGLNAGPSEPALHQCREQLEMLSKKFPGQKVTLVGHSLGGVFARELARAFPDQVDQVITLGAPFGADEHHSELPVRVLLKAFHLLYGGHRDFVGRSTVSDHLMEPLPVPTTAVYSQNDGVVNWRQCITAPADNAENVEVQSSHIGFGMNKQSITVLLDRLNQAPGTWAPFDRAQYAHLGYPREQAHETYEMPYRPKRPHGSHSKIYR